MATEQATIVPAVPKPESKLATVRRYFAGYDAKSGYDGRRLTRGQKSAISRKYNELVRFQSQYMTHPGDQWVRVRTTRPEAVANLEKLGPQGAVYPKGLKPYRVVSLPPNVSGVAVDRKGRIMQIVGPREGDPRSAKFAGIKVYFQDFDPVLMATRPDDMVLAMTKMFPGATAYGVRSGRYGWVFEPMFSIATRARNVEVMGQAEGMEITRGQLMEAVTRLSYRYGAPIEVLDSDGDPEPRADEDRENFDGTPYEIRPNVTPTHHYEQWMTGMVAVYTPKNDALLFDQFMTYKRRLRTERARDRQRRHRQKIKGK